MPASVDTQYPTFQPAFRVIAAITNSYPAMVTTNLLHQYQSGLIVRLLIPPTFGMTEANQLEGAITVINTTQFTIPIDTTNFTPFTIPSLVQVGNYYFAPGGQAGVPSVIPVGEINELLTESTQNVLPYPLNMIS